MGRRSRCPQVDVVMLSGNSAAAVSLVSFQSRCYRLRESDDARLEAETLFLHFLRLQERGRASHVEASWCGSSGKGLAVKMLDEAHCGVRSQFAAKTAARRPSEGSQMFSDGLRSHNGSQCLRNPGRQLRTYLAKEMR